MKIEVLYLGPQLDEDKKIAFYLVNEPKGSTIVYRKELHKIVGVVNEGTIIPEELKVNIVRDEIINKIIESVKDKVYETFNNQANRIIDIRNKWHAWDKIHCETWNDFRMDSEVKKQKLAELKENDPRKGLLLGDRENIRETEERIRQIYVKKADRFLENIAKYVEDRLKGDVITSIENIHLSGFSSGSWKINGNKIFSFRTILAGGYNIQCLHIRVIYSYKELK